MCGIAGVYTPDRPVAEGVLARMAASLHHRGPDGQGTWSGWDVGLAHTRLAVVDLSPRGAQPMLLGGPDPTAVIVFNGEIYNHQALRRELIDEGLSFRSASDTEVLLAGWMAHGPRFLERVEGMFAFALWDAAERTLHLVRDRAGEKPLYVAPLPDGGIAFGSEPKAVRAAVELKPDVSRLPSYLLQGYVSPPHTLYQGLLALEPGHHARVGPDGRLRRGRYWAPTFDPSPNPLPYADACHELRARFARVVRDRLEADVPVGAFLSGGLDSAAVVGVATRDLGRTVHTYSIGFDEPGLDEAADAALSARHLSSIHTEFRVSHTDVPPMELLVEHHDGPFADSSAIPTYLVSKLARSRVTVALTGDGGDELFAGYPRFLGGLLGERVPRTGAQLAAKVGGKLADVALSPVRQRVEQGLRLVEATTFPLGRRLLRWNAIFPLEILPRLIREEYGSEVLRAANFSDEVFLESRRQAPLDRMLDHNFRTYLAEDLLPKVDRMSMAVALETRAPFLDSGLIRFAGSLPDGYKIRGTTLKRIVRDAFKDLYVPELLERPKRGFGVPLLRWLRGPLREAWSDLVLSRNARLYRYLDPGVVRTLLSFDPGTNRAWPHQVFALWTLETWLRREGA